MATLKVYVRSKSKSSVVPYARYSVKAGQILYGRLKTAINTEYWDEKQQKLIIRKSRMIYQSDQLKNKML